MAKQKRPSLLDNIDMDAGQGATSASAKVVEIAPQAKTAKKAPTVKSSLYLPPKAHRLLKEIAFAKNCKVHDLFIEGIDHVLTGKGYATVEELSKK